MNNTLKIAKKWAKKERLKERLNSIKKLLSDIWAYIAFGIIFILFAGVPLIILFYFIFIMGLGLS